MSNVVEEHKLVELKYAVVDQKSGQVLTSVDYPLGYIHGHNEILAPAVHAELAGKKVGDTIDVPIDCNELYGPRDETLVFTDSLENVPKEYQEVGTTIVMENNQGQTRNFIVTRVDEKSITVDGNNPLCGRRVIFKLEIVNLREPTEEELEAGGAIEQQIDVEGTKKMDL